MGRFFVKAAAVGLSLVLAVGGLSPEAAAVQYSGTASYMSGIYYQSLRKVRLSGEPRRDVVAIARSQLGYQEGGSPNQLSGEIYGGVNHTEYGAWYGMQDMWCAMFVSWCAHLAGVSTEVVPSHCFTPDGLQWFASRGQAYSRSEVEQGSYVPQPGDLVYFKSSRNTRTTNHVGLVTGYADGLLYTIEGNVGAAGTVTNGGCVVDKIYPITNGYIVYICSPDYETVATNVASEDQGSDLQLRNMLSMLDCGGAVGYDTVGQSGTLGIGQWSGSEAVDLLERIRREDEAAFARLDTAGVGLCLEQGQLPDTAEAAQCLSRILASRAGVRVQENKMKETIHRYTAYARSLGVTEEKAQLLCGAIQHLGGREVLRRCTGLAGEDLSPSALLTALEKVNPRLYRSCRSIKF